MPAATSTIPTLIKDLENVWQALDQLFGQIKPEDWSRKHGPDWTYADVPYHLSYFDREMVAVPIERSLDIPENQRKIRQTMAELNLWNTEEFGKRPASQTVEESLSQMKISRQAVCRAATLLSNDELSRPSWMGLPGAGWITALSALESCYLHTWGHFMELRLRMKKTEPQLSPAQTHRAISIMMSLMVGFADREQAHLNSLTAVINITGPGGGAWTIWAANGECRVEPGLAPDAELIISQSPETMVAMRVKMINPLLAMLTGKLKVKGFKKMSTFGKIIKEPALDKVLPVNLDPHSLQVADLERK